MIEVGGPDSFLQSLQAIRIGGQINMVGYIGSKHGAINPLEILYHRATVRGIPVGSRESFEAMNRAIEANNPEPERVIIAQRQSADARRCYRLGKSMSLM